MSPDNRNMKQIVADHMNTMKTLVIDSPTATGKFRGSYNGVLTPPNQTLATSPRGSIATSPRVSKDFKVKKGVITGRRPKPYQITQSAVFTSPSINATSNKVINRKTVGSTKQPQKTAPTLESVGPKTTDVSPKSPLDVKNQRNEETANLELHTLDGQLEGLLESDERSLESSNDEK